MQINTPVVKTTTRTAQAILRPIVKAPYGKGTVTFYPANYGWQRLQEFHEHGRNARFRPTIAAVAGLTSARSLRAHQIATDCALGHFAVITPNGRSALIASLLGYIETHGAEGLEGLLFSAIMYAQSSADHTLFARGIAAWKNRPATNPRDAVPILDVKSSRVGILSASDITDLGPTGKAAGAFTASSVADQLFGFLDMGVSSDGCEQAAGAIGAAAGVVVGGVAGFIGGGIAGAGAGTVTLPVIGSVAGASAGAYAGAAAGALAGGASGKGIGDAVGSVVCGWTNDDDAPDDDQPDQDDSEFGDSTIDSNESGDSSDQSEENQSNDDDQSGDNNPDDNYSGYPNPDDFPNPDGPGGFQITSMTLMSAVQAANMVAADGKTAGVFMLQQVPQFNEVAGKLSVSAGHLAQVSTIANQLSVLKTGVLTSSLISGVAKAASGLAAKATP